MSATSAVLHHDCVACRAINEHPSVGEETMVMICMLLCGHTIDGIYKGLCFVHKRRIDQAAAGMLEEMNHEVS